MRAGFASIMLFALFQLGLAGNDPTIASSLILSVAAFLIYVPLGYHVDRFFWRRRMAKAGRALPQASREALSMDVRTFTVGPVQENCHIARRDGAREAVVIDPGDEAERLLEAIAALELEVAAILLTHTHFDHVGAVAPRRPRDRGGGLVPGDRGAGARRHHALRPVGRASARSSPTTPTTSSRGGETLQLAGLDIEVLFTPGHSPGHVTYSVPAEQAVFSGDVLFAGSIGRTDLPGGDHATLMRTLATLAETLPGRDRRVPRAHADDDHRARARLQPVPRSSSRERAASRHRAARSTCWARTALARDALEGHARRILEGAGYRRIETPTFEATELFARGVGESTDVVQKEMFTFDSGEDQTFTLRPEGTAPVCRAYLEHGMHKQPQPVKLWYLSSYFRRERPQKGRFRQFWQVGIEAIGSDDPGVDAEVDPAARRAARGARLPRRPAAHRLARHARDPRRLPRGAPGLPARPRGAPRARGRRAHRRSTRCAPSTPTTAARRRSWPARRACSTASTTRTRRTSPRCGRCSTRSARPTRSTPTLVRGLDYYTRTVFEFTSDALGAQSGVGGGGRYDGLIEQIGGPPTPGIGWAAGVERMLLTASTIAPAEPALDLYVGLRRRAYRHRGVPARRRRAPGRAWRRDSNSPAAP